MLRNYLLIAVRHLFRHRGFSLIKVLGLAMGMAACLLILQYVAFEWSYDRFHAKADRIFRIRMDAYKNGHFDGSGLGIYHSAGPAIREAFPEVESCVRLHPADGMFSHQDEQGKMRSFHETRAYYADSSFFRIFSFPFVQGSAERVLRNPSGLVISRSAARKYFGDGNPMGKTIRLHTDWEGGEYVVEGVFEDMPANSHLQADFLFSIQSLLANRQFKNGGWYWTNFYTYLLLKENVQPNFLEAKFPALVERHLGKEHRKSNSLEALMLQPLTTIHLHSDAYGEMEGSGNAQTVKYLLLIAFAILLIAWLNYINLSTAKATERAREVGIRKVLGSKPWQLVRQFLLEAALLNALAGLGALVLAWLVKPIFESVVGQAIRWSFDGSPELWGLFAGLFVAGAFLSGLYPALVLASFPTISVLKGKFFRRSGGESLRKVLVMFQFTTSLVLIIATLVVYQQIRFMQRQDLGMNLERKLVIRFPKVVQAEDQEQSVSYFKEQLKRSAAVRSVTASSQVPGKGIFWSAEYRRLHDPESWRKGFSILAVDADFFSSYEMHLLAGRNFSSDMKTDSTALIINESALKAFGFENPEAALNEDINTYPVRKIVGVVRDFHQQTLMRPIEPIVFFYQPEGGSYYTIRLKGNALSEAVETVKATYQRIYPENAFEGFFLDDYFNQQYQAEKRFEQTCLLFSGIAIFIACLGLLGLASFIAATRIKEVGIRKVLGASRVGVLLLLNRQMIILILFAQFLSWPLAYLIAHTWLQKYTHRIDLQGWLFVLPGLGVLLIAFLTISFQTWKAANANPAVLLRSE
jgi:putative ABC transport system permease protein